MKQACLSPFLQFCLSKSDKEQYEKEERPESQQEILRRAAKDLPVYTTTTSRGKPFRNGVSVAFTRPAPNVLSLFLHQQTDFPKLNCHSSWCLYHTNIAKMFLSQAELHDPSTNCIYSICPCPKYTGDPLFAKIFLVFRKKGW